MHKSAKRQTIKQNSQKTVRNVSNNQIELAENSAQGTNVPKSQREILENSAQGTNVANNETELTESSAQRTKVPV